MSRFLHNHTHDTLILVLSAVASALTPIGCGVSVQMENFYLNYMNAIVHPVRNTLSWKIHCTCNTLPPVYSSGGHYSDDVCCVTLEVSKGGLSCCWITELPGGLTTSLRAVGHSGGVEAVRSWA